ncbi:hypothetical protein PAXRUDRAFT_836089 [Paxillus rubicundulus Ve08.2h10]|uniref:Uncharacterized protein n=1 Tax=Paxillus rubicundulus Ve08.2h10 TaxID=930991 RepID=A0A0D0CSV2_9AGAM|nr:hypothetical protein PAXRUDRAFT_836089 [Paxillus rubicundulus Ve08.2h10]
MGPLCLQSFRSPRFFNLHRVHSVVAEFSHRSRILDASKVPSLHWSTPRFKRKSLARSSINPPYSVLELARGVQHVQHSITKDVAS